MRESAVPSSALVLPSIQGDKAHGRVGDCDNSDDDGVEIHVDLDHGDQPLVGSSKASVQT